MSCHVISQCDIDVINGVKKSITLPYIIYSSIGFGLGLILVKTRHKDRNVSHNRIKENVFQSQLI